MKVGFKTPALATPCNLKTVLIIAFLALEMSTTRTAGGDGGGREGSPPGRDDLVNRRKTWWVKRVASGVYTTGRLSFRQIKYLSDEGFRGVVSLFRFPRRGVRGDEVLPDSSESHDVTARLGGMHFIELLQFEENAPHQWAHVFMMQRFARAIQTMERPLVVCSRDGFSATLLSLLYAASNSSHNASSPLFSTANIVAMGASHGYDYSSSVYTDFISQVTGDHSKEQLRTPDVAFADWSKLWLIKPVIRNWFVAGQLQKNHVGLLKELGFVSIVNSRKRVTDMLTGAPAQEEVTLLNIRDDLLTSQGRQQLSVLEAHRIDPNKTNEYISHDSRVNYESRNYYEYGDSIGYNETLERIHVGTNSLDYLSTPIDVDGPFPYTVEIFEKYKESILAEGRKGKVLVHCASGHRATILVLALAGLQYQKDSKWALQRAEELGYSYTIDAVNVLRTVLDNRYPDTAEQAHPFSHHGLMPSTVLTLYALSGVLLAGVCMLAAIVVHKVIVKRREKATFRFRMRFFDDTPPLLKTTDM